MSKSLVVAVLSLIAVHQVVVVAEEHGSIQSTQAPNAATADSQVLLNVMLIELALESSDSSEAESERESDSVYQGFSLATSRIDPRSPLELMKSMKEIGSVKVISDLHVTLIDRQTAELSSGGFVELSNPPGGKSSERNFIGTKLNATPQIVSKRKLYVDLLMRNTELFQQPNAEDGIPSALRIREFDTTIAAEFGKTSVLGGLINNTKRGEKDVLTELILLVVPETSTNADVSSRLPATKVHAVPK